MEGISIVFPHADNPENNRVLELQKKLLRENTKGKYQLSYLSGNQKEDVYPAWNWLISRAKYDLVLWTNTDLLPAPNWDILVKKYQDKADWLSMRVVECGQIGVAFPMIERDFGITASSFERKQFEYFAEEESKKHPEFEEGFVWYCPSVFKKKWFLDNGGFPTDKPYPYPNDSLFRQKVEKGCRFGVVNSWFYHLQRAGENSGEKKERK